MKNCVIVPIYEEITEKIINVLKHNILKIEMCNRHNWDICMIYPQNFNVDAYKQLFPMCFYMEIDFWIGDVESYNRMCLDTKFYSMFVDYEYIFICHTDALILKNSSEMDDILDAGYGFIGAPWYKVDGSECGWKRYKRNIRGMYKVKLIELLCAPRICKVGNGGASLRNVKAIMHLLRAKHRYVNKWNDAEDIFFAYWGQKINGFLPNVEVAETFALETDMKNRMLLGVEPIVVHKWEVYNVKLGEILSNK